MSNNPHKSILLTGANGFIGSHLFSYLNILNTQVRVLIRNNKSNVSLLDGSSVKKYCLQNKIKTIAHLASMVKRIKSDEDICNEINMAVNLISSLESGGKFIYFSSADVYENSLDILCEHSLISPVNMYAKAKFETELALQKVADMNDIELIILRPSLVYGSGVPKGMFLYDLKQSLIEGKTFFYSSSTITRDFIHVNDVVKAVAKIIRHHEFIGGIYNLSTGIGNSLSNIVEITKEISKRDFLVDRDKLKGSPSSLILNPGKLEKTIKWRPSMQIEKGLKDFFYDE
ncbi:NAD(P)-dependent oxidoreductase [Gammaproteobacteria bacterium]|nr:NAD(P)-dependent oxidoreductase [Gammaproteobacteria bacterium]|tara:strand:+ start:18448 stop:19308 length:861 start_codon:yes stop_codon:yes gene_type:complete